MGECAPKRALLAALANRGSEMKKLLVVVVALVLLLAVTGCSEAKKQQQAEGQIKRSIAIIHEVYRLQEPGTDEADALKQVSRLEKGKYEINVSEEPIYREYSDIDNFKFFPPERKGKKYTKPVLLVSEFAGKRLTDTEAAAAIMREISRASDYYGDNFISDGELSLKAEELEAGFLEKAKKTKYVKDIPDPYAQ
jgi:hypothetical protein